MKGVPFAIHLSGQLAAGVRSGIVISTTSYIVIVGVIIFTIPYVATMDITIMAFKCF